MIAQKKRDRNDVFESLALIHVEDVFCIPSRLQYSENTSNYYLLLLIIDTINTSEKSDIFCFRDYCYII